MAALLAGGSFAVHQLRFSLAYGSHSSAVLARQGHAYLSVVAPLVIGALMLAAAHFARSLARARGDAAAPSLRRLWSISTVTLIGVYCVQELAEGFLASGHPVGLVGVFGGGGWLAVPLALAAGLVIALLMRGAVSLTGFVARRRRRSLPRPTAVRAVPHAAAHFAPAAIFLTNAGPRAPPRLSA